MTQKKYKIILCFGLMVGSLISLEGLGQKAPLESSDILKLNETDSVQLVKTWNPFLQSIQQKQFAQLKGLSLDTITFRFDGNPEFKGNSRALPLSTFIDSTISKFSGSRILQVISDSGFKISVMRYPNRRQQGYRAEKNKKLVLYSVLFKEYIPTGGKRKDLNFYVFKFVKVSGQFKFCELHIAASHGNKYLSL